MNFFRSILAEESDPPLPDNPPKSPTNPSQEHRDDDNNDDVDDQSDQSSPNPNSSAAAGGWSFGGLIKTFATRSESVIETYRRDLKEFGSGLQKETAVFREVASRAVKDLPSSIEVGASVAHGSLGHAIDGVLKSTAEIIAHGKETLLAPSDGESDSESHSHSNQNLTPRRYSRFEAQLRSIQSDANSYCEEPEDLEDYNKWKLGFVLEEKSDEVKSLIEENESIEGMYKRVVPNVVDHETFWFRYFFRVHKLKLQENVRANLVKRAISSEDDEELTWDVDDDNDDEEESNGLSKGNSIVTVENKELGSQELPQVVKSETNEAQVESSKVVDSKEEIKPNVDDVDKGNVIEASSEKVTNEEVHSEQTSEEVKNNVESVSKSDEKVALDGKVDTSESCKDSDLSIVSTEPSLLEEEDLGWDEIEDLGSNDEKKVSHGESPNRDDLRKRMSAADEDEDLSWDIEDDDEPVTKRDTM